MPLKRAYEPFEKWGMDFVGLSPASSKGHQYILVCTDYVTEWAEAESLPNGKAFHIMWGSCHLPI